MTRSFYGPTPAKSLRLTSPQRARIDRTLPRAGVKPPKVCLALLNPDGVFGGFTAQAIQHLLCAHHGHFLQGFLC